MTDEKMHFLTVSQCISPDWCRGYNEAVKEANEVINRQKEEISKKDIEIDILIQKKEDLSNEVSDLRAEIERLTDKIFVLENDLENAENLNDALGNDVDIKLNHIYDLEEKLAQAKSEAYKEFAEKLLKRKYLSSDWSHGEHPYVVEESDIEDLLYELTEKGR